MICKPIKTGCTIYCVNFSKSCYLYTWEWYTGSTEGDAPQGQPTDCDTLEEDNAQHTGYVLPLCMRLIRAAFDGTFCTVYTDKAFTTIRLARALAKRGIHRHGARRDAPEEHATGCRPLLGLPRLRQERGRRPVARLGASRLLHPHGGARPSVAADGRDVARQHLRHDAVDRLVLEGALQGARSPHPHSAVRVRPAPTCCEPLLAPTQVRRWTSALRARVELACSQQLLRYTKMLGGVDRFNKMLVATRMGDPNPNPNPNPHLSP